VVSEVGSVGLEPKWRIIVVDFECLIAIMERLEAKVNAEIKTGQEDMKSGLE
jgi:hypothetical protein